MQSDWIAGNGKMKRILQRKTFTWGLNYFLTELKENVCSIEKKTREILS